MKPSTTSGRLALWFFAAFVALMFLFFAGVSVGERGGDDFFDNLRLTLPVLGAYAAAVAATIIGIVSMIRHHERAPLVVGVIVVGGLVTLFGVLEVAVPH